MAPSTRLQEHPSGQLNHLGALDADTTDAGPERTLW
jgi:hypothetical protein